MRERKFQDKIYKLTLKTEVPSVRFGSQKMIALLELSRISLSSAIARVLLQVPFIDGHLPPVHSGICFSTDRLASCCLGRWTVNTALSLSPSPVFALNVKEMDEGLNEHISSP